MGCKVVGLSTIEEDVVFRRRARTATVFAAVCFCARASRRV
jgi:hypothetical protein